MHEQPDLMVILYKPILVTILQRIVLTEWQRSVEHDNPGSRQGAQGAVKLTAPYHTYKDPRESQSCDALKKKKKKKTRHLSW